ncbi:hypothetical protein [Ruegeria sp. HKCCD8929]|uniref:hypothetical protein n=1 Tax=Ruegeria sp. HKCCD8929 TaxID=2683006 RepID=UPI001489F0C7|nr:hypothetical protein [Ruegeria sp. HKCCD8929]
MDATALNNDDRRAPLDGDQAHREGFTLEDNPFQGRGFDDRLAPEWASDWQFRHRFALDNGLHAEIGRVACLQYLRDSRTRWV